MKTTLFSLIVALFLAAGPALAWKDCNLPANKAQCEAEFQAREAQRVIDQANMTNQDVCEKYLVCGGGAGGAGAGAGGGGH